MKNPLGLSDAELNRLIENFPKESLADFEMNRRITRQKSYPFLDIVLNADLAEKFGITYYYQQNKDGGNKVAEKQIRKLVKWIGKHPLVMSQTARTVFGQSFFAQDLAREKINYQPDIRVTDPTAEIITPPEVENVALSHASAAQAMETVKQNINIKILDSINVLINSVKPSELDKQTVDKKIKLMESLMRCYSMFKGEAAATNMIQVNINNLSLEEKRKLSNKVSQ